MIIKLPQASTGNEPLARGLAWLKGLKGGGECRPFGVLRLRRAKKTRVSAQDDAFGGLEGAA